MYWNEQNMITKKTRMYINIHIDTTLYRSNMISYLQIFLEFKKKFKKTSSSFCFICVLYLHHWFDQNHYFGAIKNNQNVELNSM